MKITTKYDIGDKVKLTEPAIKMNGGKQIDSGEIDEIVIDNNGVWYSVMHNISEGGMDFRSIKAREFMLRMRNTS
jgi:hypothetical protein